MGREEEGSWLLSRAVCVEMTGGHRCVVGRVTGGWRWACTRLLHEHVNADLSTRFRVHSVLGESIKDGVQL
jgi:hypothetical protein